MNKLKIFKRLDKNVDIKRLKKVKINIFLKKPIFPKIQNK